MPVLPPLTVPYINVPCHSVYSKNGEAFLREYNRIINGIAKKQAPKIFRSLFFIECYNRDLHGFRLLRNL